MYQEEEDEDEEEEEDEARSRVDTTRTKKRNDSIYRPVGRSDGELRLLLTVTVAAGSRGGGGGVVVVVIGRAGGVAVQPWGVHGCRRVEVGHLALEHGAVGGEGGGRDVEVEGDAEEKVHLQVVHLHQADASHTREVGVVVASAHQQHQQQSSDD